MNVGGFIGAVLEVLSHPGSNLTAATLLAAAGVLVVLIGCIAVLLAVLPGAKPKRKQRPLPVLLVGAEDEDVAPEPRSDVPSRRVPAIRTALVLALALAAVVSAYTVTSTDPYCTNTCHTPGSRAPLVSRGSGPHASVACVSCHEDALPLGLAGNVASRFGQAYDYFAANRGGSSPASDSRRCLGCHADISTSTLRDAKTKVRVAHRQPLAAGMTCDDCHTNVAHGKAPDAVSMTSCVRCHDGTTASAKCSTCHDGDTGLASAGSSGRLFTKVRLSADWSCGGCHDQVKCDACHGLRMPHDTAFRSGGHARYAAFAKKAMCYRCHNDADCGKCHGDFKNAHGGPDLFFPRHKTFTRDALCNTCHSHHQGTMCSLCH
ncbi:MAG TPA: cytochrome c3 family protein [Coriobacteriia bacterium]|jgi:hypothetical protein